MIAINQQITGAGAPPCTCFQIHGARPGFMWESLYQSTSGKRTSIQTGAPAVISRFINHSKYIETSTINHSEIGVMFTNLAFTNSSLGHHQP